MKSLVFQCLTAANSLEACFEVETPSFRFWPTVCIHGYARKQTSRYAISARDVGSLQGRQVGATATEAGDRPLPQRQDQEGVRKHACLWSAWRHLVHVHEHDFPNVAVYVFEAASIHEPEVLQRVHVSFAAVGRRCRNHVVNSRAVIGT